MNITKIKNIYVLYMIIAAVMTWVAVYMIGSAGLENLRASYIKDVAIDTVGMLTCEILFIGLYAEENGDKQNHSMFRMILSLIVLLFMDLLTSFWEGNPNHVTGIITINTVSFIFEVILAYAYWTYIRNELNLKGRFVRVANKICLYATWLTILLDIVNIKFGFLFKISEAGEYIDGRFEFLGDLAIIAVFILAAVAIFLKSDARINEKLILITFETFPLTSYIVGSLTQEYTYTNPAYLLSILLIYIRIFSERGKKLAEQQVLLTKQSTALMISQIQPHFLYNVLTTISNLCVTDPEEAEETTVLFSQYLRTNLDSLRNQEPVPFMTELGHIKTYVELEKKRFGDILNVEYDIKEQNFNVPSLGLQPIVENSIKHGIRGKNAPGHIIISTYKEDDKYKIVIEDDGIGFDMNQPPKDDGRSHVGMINVKERLRQMCNATVEIVSSPGNGCRTEITIPE